MLKITKLSNLALKTFKANNNEVVKISGKAYKIFKNLSKSKKLKNKKSENLTYIKVIEKPIFLTFNAKKIFNHLK